MFRFAEKVKQVVLVVLGTVGTMLASSSAHADSASHSAYAVQGTVANATATGVPVSVALVAGGVALVGAVAVGARGFGGWFGDQVRKAWDWVKGRIAGMINGLVSWLRDKAAQAWAQVASWMDRLYDAAKYIGLSDAQWTAIKHKLQDALVAWVGSTPLGRLVEMLTNLARTLTQQSTGGKNPPV